MRDLVINKKDLSEADRLLIQKCLENTGKYPVFDEEKISRMEYELNIIIDMGFSDYLLIVQDFLDVGRRVGFMPDDRIEYLKQHVGEMSIDEMNRYINEDQSYPGMTIGPGRGSAAGSEVTYLLGITNVEPIENKLLFERFLNPERVSMPDIDSDMSKSEFEYGVRDIVIEYVTKKYGRNAVCGIATPSTLAARAAVRNIARIAGEKAITEKNPENPDKVKKEYYRLGDRINYVVPTDPKTSFGMALDDSTGETLLDKLHKEFENEPAALEIIDMAAKVEGLNINYGMHACGKIIFPGDIREHYALMKDVESGIWKLQMGAEEAESSGLLKMDFLGLKNLNIITKTARLLYKNTGIKLDCYNLPQDPKVYQEVFSKGKTFAVFQFESDGMRNMLKRFGPECFDDIVLLVACYRPGPLQYLDGIIARKHHRETSKDSALMHIKEIEDIVKSTYFAIVYQEQVQQIFQVLAGYSLGQADLVRRAMGHKKIDVLEKERESFLHGDPERGIVGCEANGIDLSYAEQLFEDMMDFARYAFNRSHAAAYATVAYATAYLKYHYPTEFYTSVLEFADIDKYPQLVAEAKDFGVTVHGPNIERSENRFTGKDSSIYFGLSKIKGVGTLPKMNKESMKSIGEFMLHTDFSESVIRTLVEVGAFDSKIQNRAALLAVIPDYFSEKSVITKKEKEIGIYREMLLDLERGISLDRKKYKITTKSLPDKKKLLTKIADAEDKVREAKENIRQIIVPSERIADDKDWNLARELELLGMYASGHPLDVYGLPQDHQCLPISELQVSQDKNANYQSIFGMVTKCRNVKQKSDGKDMCFFTLSDQTGEVDCCCFASSFALCGRAISDGAVLKLNGKVTKRRGSDDGCQFVLDNKVDAALPICDKIGDYYLRIHGIEEWPKVRMQIMPYIVSSGHPVFLYDEDTGSLYRLTGFRATEAMLRDSTLSVQLVS